jgi:hypothetical protein
MSRQMWERLTAGMHMLERCLEAAFRFLLDREPKESILGQFDVKVISSYFRIRAGAGALPLAVLRELCFATIRRALLGYLENVGSRFLSLRHELRN